MKWIHSGSVAKTQASLSANQQIQILKASRLDTPLGPMVAIASDDALYLLEFVDRRGLEREVERLCQRTKSAIITGTSAPCYAILVVF